jgi:hypothetical protein
MNMGSQAESDIVLLESLVKVSKVLSITVGCALQVERVATVHGVVGHHQSSDHTPVLRVFFMVVLFHKFLNINIIVERVSIGVLIGKGFIHVLLGIVRYNFDASQI